MANWFDRLFKKGPAEGTQPDANVPQLNTINTQPISNREEKETTKPADIIPANIIRVEGTTIGPGEFEKSEAREIIGKDVKKIEFHGISGSSYESAKFADGCNFEKEASTGNWYLRRIESEIGNVGMSAFNRCEKLESVRFHEDAQEIVHMHLKTAHLSKKSY
jgi:hypothetical protein